MNLHFSQAQTEIFLAAVHGAIQLARDAFSTNLVSPFLLATIASPQEILLNKEHI